MQEKIEAIRNLRFPETLRQLEYTIDFFGYYRKFIGYYAYISEPLVKIKTKGFKTQPPDIARAKFGESKKLIDVATLKELEAAKIAYEELKDKLYIVFILAFPDFKKSFIFYIDDNKEKGFDVAIY
jgi:hypothetical protein